MTSSSTITKTFPVTNLSCASCAGNTEAVLKEQNGVEKAEVNYANSSAKIEFLSSVISPEKLIEQYEETIQLLKNQVEIMKLLLDK